MAESDPSSIVKQQYFIALKTLVQKKIWQIKSEWWIAKAAETQAFMDRCDMRNFYTEVKTAYGSQRNIAMTINANDGHTLLKDEQAVLTRWAEHFETLLNHLSTVDPHILNGIPQQCMWHELDTLLTILELFTAIIRVKKNYKAVGFFSGDL